MAALSDQRDRILEIAAAHGAHDVRVFGSMARGTANQSSDIDLLVSMDPDRSLLDLCALGDDLEDLLGKRVDIVTDRGLSPYLRDEILRTAVPL
jgi:uncharacterized protein